MEEVGELSRLMVRTYGEQSFKESDKGKDLGDEMADVLWVLICLANQTGVNLTDALQKNFEKKNLNQMDLMPFITGVTVPKLNQERMRAIEIPLPPLALQENLALDIEQERAQVDSAKKLIETYEARTQAVITKLWSE
jgi:hypothetical protein